MPVVKALRSRWAHKMHVFAQQHGCDRDGNHSKKKSEMNGTSIHTEVYRPKTFHAESAQLHHTNKHFAKISKKKKYGFAQLHHTDPKRLKTELFKILCVTLCKIRATVQIYFSCAEFFFHIHKILTHAGF